MLNEIEEARQRFIKESGSQPNIIRLTREQYEQLKTEIGDTLTGERLMKAIGNSNEWFRGLRIVVYEETNGDEFPKAGKLWAG